MFAPNTRSQKDKKLNSLGRRSTVRSKGARLTLVKDF
jgi:hypothetical protein